MAAGEIRAGKAFVELFTKDQGLVKGLQRAQEKLAAFAAGAATVGRNLFLGGGAAVTGLFGASKAFAAMGDSLAKASVRTGIAVEALSELKYAAESSGVEFSDFEGSLRKMTKLLVDANGGSKEAAATLQKLGLSVADLQGKSGEDVFAIIADSISRIPDGATRAAMAMDVFGRNGTAMLPMVAAGAAGIRQLREEAQRLGLTMSTDSAKAAEAYKDALDRLWKVTKHAIAAIGGAVAPVLQRMANWITDVTVKTTKWIKEHQDLVQWLLVGAAALAAGGAALWVFGKALGFVLAIVPAIATALGTIGSVLAVIKSAAVGLVGFLVTPLGLVVAAIGGMVTYWLASSGAMGDAVSWLGEKFGFLGEDVSTVIKGISNALSAGNLPLAAQVLWAGIKVIWQQGCTALTDSFYAAIKYMKELWIGLGNHLARVWSSFAAWFNKLTITIGAEFAKGKEQIKYNADPERMQAAKEESYNKAQADQRAMNMIADIRAGKRGTEGMPAQAKREFEAGRDWWAAKAWGKEIYDKEMRPGHEAKFKALMERNKTEGAALDEFKKQVDDNAKKMQAQVEEELGAEFKKIDDESQKQMNTLDTNDKAAAAGREGRAKAELDKAKAELKKLTSQAEDEAAGSWWDVGPRALPKAPEVPEFLAAGRGADKITSTGTFSAFAAANLGGGTVAQRTAKATEATAKAANQTVEGLKKVQTVLEDYGPTFTK